MNRAVWSTNTLRSLLSRYWFISLCAFISLALMYEIISWRSTSLTPLSGTFPGSHSVHYTALPRGRQKSLQPIDNSTLGFQKILALNLPERTDHHDGLVLAGVVSNINIDFVDGVRGDAVPAKALPPYPDAVLEHPGAIGAWRAHMNAISQVVTSGWGSALILEDDVDWDIRIRSQLQNIALGADFVLANSDKSVTVSAGDVQHSHVPQSSPYGDDWDVMWLGHCGMEIAEHPTIMIFENDATVPQTKDIISWNGEEKEHLSKFPPFSRIVTQQKGGTCSLAYAVSQRGARKLLFELGLQKLDAAFDLMLHDFCEGRNGRAPHRCVSVMPQIFDHYRAAGRATDSDVGGPGSGGGQTREKSESFNIRWSVRLNMEKLLNGETDYSDQYPSS